MRKHVFCLLLGCAATLDPRFVRAQELQLHYDWRHTTDPRNNARNFPSLAFKTFKALEFGSFLLKLEADLNGTRHNVSKGYMEISQTLRFWAAPIYVLGEYSGGLGVFDGGNGGFYLDNAYHIGASHPFPWQGGFGNVSLAYRYANLSRASHDPQASLYWGRTFGGRWSFASTGVFWTQNRNRGDERTADLTGKRDSFLVENEIWWRVAGLVSVGSNVRVSRNVYATDGRLLVYPTMGIRYRF
jgi:Domain of unknown function (DUF5020)